MAESYEKAGVNLEAGYEVVRRIKNIIADRLAVIVETVVDERLPVFLGNLFQGHHLSKTVERILRVAEYIHHHVAYTAIETVGRIVLSLPHRTHGSFQALPVGQVCQLLELINTHDDMDAFCLGNLSEVYHGVATPCTQFGNDVIFDGLDKRIEIGRYHSWVVSGIRDMKSCSPSISRVSISSI